MKRFGLLLVTLGTFSVLGTPPARSQVEVAAPLPVEAPRAKNATTYHEAMCNRMCVQLGDTKRTEVCGNNKKTYNNACAAKCAKVAYTRGPCPEEKKKEENAVVALDEDAVKAQLEAEDKRPGGKVKWFDWDKGYGAVLADDGQELYVDASAVTGDAVETLKQGDRVKFDITKGPKGMQAAKVALELTEEQKEAKLEQAGSLQVVGEQKLAPVGRPQPLMREAKSNDGVYVLPRR